jgi:hypothetical protein
MSRYGRGASAFIAYAATSVALFGLPIARTPSRSYIGLGPGGDAEVQMWFLAWWPHALLNGNNPWLTDQIWAPTGTNLAWANSVPGAALVAAPVTLIFGPVASYNSIVLLAPALAAWAAYLLCRELTGRFWPSLVGGFLYGFSTYELGHLLGHLSHVLVFPVPILAYLVVRRVRGTLGRGAFVTLASVALIAQFLFAKEIFATTTLFGAMALAVAVALFPHFRPELLATAGLAGVSYAVAAVVLSPYLYHLVAYGARTNLQPSDVFASDLLNFVVPTPVTALGGAWLEPVSGRFTAGYIESTAYLGLPLLAVVAHFVVTQRARRAAQLVAISLAVICLASFGPTLRVGGASVGPLPTNLVFDLPLMQGLLPARLTLFAFLAAAVAVALWLAEADRTSRLRWPIAVIAVVFLLPNIVSPFWKSDRFWRANAVTAPFFADKLYERYLAPGDTILLFPYGYRAENMLVQAESGMYFRMAGGYASSEIPSEFLRWPLLSTLYSGEPVPDFEAQFPEFLCAHRVEAIIVDPSGAKPWEDLISNALQARPQTVGGVSLYRAPAACRQAKANG